MLRQGGLRQADHRGQRADFHLARPGEVAQHQQPLLVRQQPQQPATKIGAYSAASEKAKSAAVEDIDDIDEIFKIFNKD